MILVGSIIRYSKLRIKRIPLNSNFSTDYDYSYLSNKYKSISTSWYHSSRANLMNEFRRRRKWWFVLVQQTAPPTSLMLVSHEMITVAESYHPAISIAAASILNFILSRVDQLSPKCPRPFSVCDVTTGFLLSILKGSFCPSKLSKTRTL